MALNPIGASMLIIKVEMWPKGDKLKARLMEQAFIYNDGAGTDAEFGDYTVQLLKSPRFMKGAGLPERPSQVTPSALFKVGRVLGFNRAFSVWELVALALRACNYPGEPR